MPPRINTSVPGPRSLETFTTKDAVTLVHYKDPELNADLSDATTSMHGTVETNAGLCDAYNLAFHLLGSNLAVERLRRSFTGAAGGENVTEEIIRESLRKGVKIYLGEDVAPNVRGFHFPPGVETVSLTLPVNHLFLSKNDVEIFLPKERRAAWTDEEAKGIVFMSWCIIHEMAHVVASILFHETTIQDYATPTEFVPWNIILYGKTRLDENFNAVAITGERGYWIESELGGLMEAVPSNGGKGASHLLLRVDGMLRRVELDNETVRSILTSSSTFTGIRVAPDQPHATLSVTDFQRVKSRNKTDILGSIPRQSSSGMKY